MRNPSHPWETGLAARYLLERLRQRFRAQCWVFASILQRPYLHHSSILGPGRGLFSSVSHQIWKIFVQGGCCRKVQPPCDLRRPGRVGRWTSDCLIQIREILLPHGAIFLPSAIPHRNINPVALWYDVFRGKAEISNALPRVCTVAFSPSLRMTGLKCAGGGYKDFAGIIFERRLPQTESDVFTE